MQRLFAVVGLLAIVLIPLRAAQVLYIDLTHPEIWDSDRQRDPRIYLPLIAAVFTCVGVWLTRALRRASARRARLDGVLKEARVLREVGDRRGAAVLMEEYERLLKG